jgi:endonuclease/exonuclease/phosphatase family metal-dependent hydrolase
MARVTSFLLTRLLPLDTSWPKLATCGVLLSSLLAYPLTSMQPLLSGSVAEASTTQNHSLLSTPPTKSLTAQTSFQAQVESGPMPLNFAQLNALALDPKNAVKLEKQIQEILNTPFIYPNATLLHMAEPPATEIQDSETQTPILRVASWNIERGFQMQRIIDLFHSQNSKKPTNVKLADFDEAKRQAQWLSKSRVIFLNEVDSGMSRTQYQNVAKKMGAALNMHAVYGVEFLELSPLYIRHEKLEVQQQEQQLRKSKHTHSTVNQTVKHSVKHSVAEAKKPTNPDMPAYQANVKIDPRQYKGLHGTAILTNYPILNVEVIRLPNVYDWYSKERKKISDLEKVKRKAADTVFLEDVLTEIRYGSRMALAVDVSVPELPERRATFVAVHLENRVNPMGRKIQMDYLLSQLKNRHNPIVLGGDWNTTGTDASPTSIRKEIRRYAADPTFWARRAVNWLTPYGLLVGLTLDAGQLTKNLYDPTAPNIPLFSPNPERALFKDLRTFQFDDGTVFDTRGNKAHAYEGNSGFLANSDQRWAKGFVPTFNFERPLFKGLFGRYKLDWFMVKDYAQMAWDEEGDETDEPPKSKLSKGKQWKEQPYLFAPHNARTLSKIDCLYPEKLSDHLPITLDLFLKEPLLSPKSAFDATIPPTTTEPQKTVNSPLAPHARL